MRVMREATALVAAMAGVAAASPAAAQFYLKSHDFSGAPVRGDEAGVLPPLPDATPAEQRANMVWTMRAALNVAALQCDFQPTLTTVANYNALLHDHKAELDDSWTTLGKYFARMNGGPKVVKAKAKAKGKSAGAHGAGESAREHYQTQVYSSFSTIQAQINFCQTASSIGRDALFAPRGQFGALAEQRIREVRNSLTPYGEQGFVHYAASDQTAMPRFDPACWSKKGEWVTKKCGTQQWTPSAQNVAAR